MTTTGKILKSHGFDTLDEFSKLVDVPVSTLKDWRQARPKRFNILIAGAKAIQREEFLKAFFEKTRE